MPALTSYDNKHSQLDRETDKYCKNDPFLLVKCIQQCVKE